MPSLTLESASTEPPPSGRSYTAMVWRQFRRDKLALAGLILIVALSLMALFAPLLASHKPLAIRYDGEWRFPLVREIFAPSPEAPEAFLERFFNFLLVYSLAALVVLLPWRLLARRAGTAWRIGALALAAVCLCPFFLVGSHLDKTDYRTRVAEHAGNWALFTPLRYGPYEQVSGSAYTAPTAGHPLGTDRSGRDVLSRLVHGTRVSLSVGFVAVGIAVLIGTVFGAVSGYHGGKTDLIMQRIVEVVICFPTFFLILTIMAFIEKRSIFNVMLVIGLTGWTGIARLIRGQALSEKSKDYIAAAQALGATPGRIIFRHLIPNSIAPVLVAATFGVAGAILTEAGLSFLGFGVRPPTASWGELLNQAQAWPTGYWWLTTFPGVMIFLTVTIYNLVGEGLRDAMDPRLRT